MKKKKRKNINSLFRYIIQVPTARVVLMFFYYEFNQHKLVLIRPMTSRAIDLLTRKKPIHRFCSSNSVIPKSFFLAYL